MRWAIATNWSFRKRLSILMALTIVTCVAMLLLPRIPQDPAYHNFTDRRSLFGIANALNVLSNLPFVLVGAIGLINMLRPALTRFEKASERWPYIVFFVGITLTCFGSAYYHLEPANERLVWDRLPMSIAFMGLFAAVIVE